MAATRTASISARPEWLRLSILTGIIGALIGFFVGQAIGQRMGFAPDDNAPLFLGYILAAFGYFLFRYPTYGGVESYELVVPTGRAVHFEITSLDVVHDFWIYDMDVKQDAVPGITTHADMLTTHPGVYPFDCDELCGIWHGYMRGDLTVVTPAQFAAWVKQQTTKVTPLHGSLPPQNDVYYPDPLSYPPAPQNSAQ